MGTPLMNFEDFGASLDPRTPKADITNARHLFGDPSSAGLDTYSTLIGDAGAGYYPQGDSAYGDSAYGDVNSIGLEAVGAPLPQWARYAAVGLAGAGAGALTAGLIARARNRALQSQLVQMQLARAASNNTITNSVLARRLMGRIPLNTPFQFYSVEGANLNQYPLAPTELFPADSLKYNLDRQASDTPFEVEIAPGVISGSNLVATASGVVAARYFGAIFITVSINALAANPGK